MASKNTLNIVVKADSSPISKTIEGLDKKMGKFNKKLAHQQQRQKAGAQALKKSYERFGGTIEKVGGVAGGQVAQLAHGFSTVKGLIAGTITGVKGFGKAAKVALAGTGIGVLVLALGSVVTYFTKFQGGLEAMRPLIGTVKALFGQLGDALIGIGGGIVKFFTGDFAGGVQAIKAGFGKFDIEGARKLGSELARAETALERAALHASRVEKNNNVQLRSLKEQIKEREKLATIAKEEQGNARKGIMYLEQALNFLKRQKALAQTITKAKVAEARAGIALEEKKLQISHTTKADAIESNKKIISLQSQIFAYQRELTSAESLQTSLITKRASYMRQITTEQKKQAELAQTQQPSAPAPINVGPSQGFNDLATDTGLGGLDLSINTEQLKQLTEHNTALENEMVRAEKIGEFGKAAYGVLASSLQSAFVNLGQTLGSGGDVLEVGIKVLGQALSSLGTVMIATGVADVTVSKSLASAFGGGWGLISAGTALVALGALIPQMFSKRKAVGSALQNAPAGGGGTTGGALGGSLATPTPPASSPALRQSGGGFLGRSINIPNEVLVKLRGADLVGVLNVTEQHNNNRAGSSGGVV